MEMYYFLYFCFFFIYIKTKKWLNTVKGNCTVTNYCDWINSIVVEMDGNPRYETIRKAAQTCGNGYEKSNSAVEPLNIESTNIAGLSTTVELPVYVMIIIGLVVFLFILMAGILCLCPHICRCKREEPRNLNAYDLNF